jgi:signal transduction histidine kinase
MLFALAAGQLNDVLARSGLLTLPHVLDVVSFFSGLLLAAVVTRDGARDAWELERSAESLARAQAELVRRERLAALGELSAVVAHEVRNPLGVIFNAMARMKQLLSPGSEGATLLEVMDEEAERLDRMVADLLDLTRPKSSSRQPVQLGELVDGAIVAARDAWSGPAAEILLDVQPGLPAAQVDPEQVRRAVVNLVTNALQATRRSEPIQVRVSSDVAQRQRIEVIDDGPGVPEHQREQVFTPFFTTRAQGTGLGLAVVHRVAEVHGGAVGVGTAHSGGAVFSLVLPEAARSQMAGPRTEPAGAARSATRPG